LVIQYENVFILDSIEAKNDGGDVTAGAMEHAEFLSNC